MKFLVLTTAALLSVTTTHAAECTNAQLTAFGNAADQAALEKACSSIIAASSVTTVDINSLATLNPCGDATCLAYFKKLQAKAPNCEVSGISLPATFDLLFSLCEVAPTNTLTPTMPTTKPAGPTKPTTTIPKTTTMKPNVNSTIDTAPTLSEEPTESPIDSITSKPTTTTVSPILPVFATPKPTVSSASAWTLSTAAVTIVVTVLFNAL